MSESFELLPEPGPVNNFFGNQHGGETGTDECLTPPHILHALDTANSFDLDPCASVVRPWPMARHHFTVEDNGLVKPWFGRVWMNPPYSELHKWTRRLAEHGDGIALAYCRTETGAFFPWVWDYAHGLFFIKGRLTFYQTNGKPMVQKKGKNAGKPATAGAPSALIAYGVECADILARCGLEGKYVPLKSG
jgi:hypothetical protein